MFTMGLDTLDKMLDNFIVDLIAEHRVILNITPHFMKSSQLYFIFFAN